MWQKEIFVMLFGLESEEGCQQDSSITENHVQKLNKTIIIGLL